MSERRVALITGASRGIGRATALALAADGLDLVLTARTLDGGTVFDGTRLGDPLAGTPLSGSITEVADECRAFGVDVATVALDLADRASVQSAAVAAISAFRGIDVFVDNAVYQGPGLSDGVMDVPFELVELAVMADALHPFLLLRHVLPSMIERGDGVVIHLTSAAATLDPNPAGVWGIGYAMAKAAAHKMVGVLHAELAHTGVRCYNLNPGHVLTDIGIARAEAAGRIATGQPPEIPAATVAWLVAGSDEARELVGTEVIARLRDQRRRPTRRMRA